jgi:hypothetical protein
MRWVIRCKTAAFAIRILVATLAHYFLVPPYRLVKEMQRSRKDSSFPCCILTTDQGEKLKDTARFWPGAGPLRAGDFG